MTPENFCYWLRGRIELGESCGKDSAPAQAEWETIKRHLDLAMISVTNSPSKLHELKNGLWKYPLDEDGNPITAVC